MGSERDRDEREFREHVRRENAREGRPLPDGSPSGAVLRALPAGSRSPAKLRGEAAESLRRYGMACRRAMDDEGHLRHVEAWARGVLRTPGLGPEVSYARAIVSALSAIRATGCEHAQALREAMKLGALLEEHHLRFGWQRDAVAGRKSRAGKVHGREAKHPKKFDPADPAVAAAIGRLLKVDRFSRRREVERVAERYDCRPSTIQSALTSARAEMKAATTPR
jgi:hypothetical protein